MISPGWRQRQQRLWLWRLTGLLGVVAVLAAVAEHIEVLQPTHRAVQRALGLDATLLVLLPLCAALGLGVWLWWSNPHRRDGRSKPATDALVRVADLDIKSQAGLPHLAELSRFLREMRSAQQPDPVAVINRLLAGGFSAGASDIHISPERDRVRITFRVDGVLHEVGALPASHGRLLANRVKVMSNLPIHTRSVPQDGAINVDHDDYQVRVSTLPTNHGEKIVLRLAQSQARRYDIDNVGFADCDLPLIKTLLDRSHGVVYLTGPTGSGKTTTLYAALTYIRHRRGDTANVVTLEDPIEVDLPHISQTQVDPASGLTFAVGLRSLLRQDPDVLMVGEIRDLETAQTAIRAALTGHLLLTTVHADSTVGVFARLRQFDLDPFQVASASIAVVNQRLAIRNCSECLAEVAVTEFQRRQFELLNVEPHGPLFQGEGCPACRGTGRSGRVPIFEILPVTDPFRDLLLADTPAHKLAASAVQAGMRRLSDQALEMARKGVLPIDEVIRILAI